MNLQDVFALVGMIGGTAPPITIVGCEPSAADEDICLTQPVRDAVEPAVSSCGIGRRCTRRTAVQTKEGAP